MPHFLLRYDLASDYLARRSEFRDQHLKLAWAASGRGDLLLGGEWALEPVRSNAVVIGGNAVLGPRRGAIADAIGGTVIDRDVRTVVTAILGAMRAHGLISS